ncbi:hypothetical protein [Demequina activiva]|uniref:Uncharacterized protein n=1 Tax=Demequina activiva TaxID=1582364 RepID=A0A919Q0S1_9MICO|nr:hypothetical protein [Demequina activiva]GIG54195.1 hypothetical protein Dac01nite_09470 [Demequina activiva]
MAQVTELAGVYDADGGVRGETAYVIGHLLGRAHCSLCDITHSPVRRKPAWDRMAATLPVPVRLLHRNELDADLADAIDGEPLALVAARVDGSWSVLLDAADLDGLDGDVDRFRGLLLSRLRERRWEPAAL